MGVAVGSAVAWLIAAVSLMASDRPVFAYIAFGMAAVSSVVAVVLYLRQRGRARSPGRPNQQFNDLIRKDYREAIKERSDQSDEDELEDVPDPFAGLRRSLDLLTGRKRRKR